MKRNEEKTWNNKNATAWERAYIAYKHDMMNELTASELLEVVNTLNRVNFIADMSDNYTKTLEEKALNNAIAETAKEMLVAC